jgi:hypothetical protein
LAVKELKVVAVIDVFFAIAVSFGLQGLVESLLEIMQADSYDLYIYLPSVFELFLLLSSYT